MKRQERRGAEGDGDLSDATRTEEERPESAEQPVAQPSEASRKDERLMDSERFDVTALWQAASRGPSAITIQFGPLC